MGSGHPVAAEPFCTTSENFLGMHKVVVTGGLGNAGTWVVDRLNQSEWDVTCIDLKTPDGAGPGGTAVNGIEFRRGDLTDHGQAWELIAEVDPDAVVHMAAVPMAGLLSESRTFETNVTSTYNVLTAAGRVGADVVWASSDAVYGSVFADPPWLPDYLPVDEPHPCRPTDPYGTSKQVGEDVAAMTARKHGVDVASLRPPLIEIPGEYQSAERRAAFDPEMADCDGEYWSYIDVRDVARAVEAALTTDLGGHEAFVVAAADNCLDRPTAATIEAVYGDLPDDCTLTGDESAFATDKARSMLGWEPRHGWRSAENETVTPPSFD
jgi:nucleoside-diphosphate-sugar epimerase